MFALTKDMIAHIGLNFPFTKGRRTATNQVFTKYIASGVGITKNIGMWHISKFFKKIN